MSSAKVMFGLALLAFCCTSQSSALKCYISDSTVSSGRSVLSQCTPNLAEDSRKYLLRNHTLVNGNTSSKFECFRESIRTSSAWTSYQGCVYSNTDVCKLPVVPHNSTLKAVICSQCNNKDGCNPAGRMQLDVLAAVMTIIIALVLRC